MKENDDFWNHLNETLTLAQQTRTAGKEVPDQDMMALILIHLPESYENAIHAIEAKDQFVPGRSYQSAKLRGSEEAEETRVQSNSSEYK